MRDVTCESPKNLSGAHTLGGGLAQNGYLSEYKLSSHFCLRKIVGGSVSKWRHKKKERREAQDTVRQTEQEKNWDFR